MLGRKTRDSDSTGNIHYKPEDILCLDPKFAMGAYYWTRFYGPYLFHSVPYDSAGNMLAEELNKIGSPVSHGCIRLVLEDAKWLYETLPLGIKISIHN